MKSNRNGSRTANDTTQGVWKDARDPKSVYLRKPDTIPNYAARAIARAMLEHLKHPLSDHGDFIFYLANRHHIRPLFLWSLFDRVVEAVSLLKHVEFEAIRTYRPTRHAPVWKRADWLR